MYWKRGKLIGGYDLEERLIQLLGPTVGMLDYEFVGLEYHAGGDGVLRVYIDHEDGITANDCASVSRQISGVLDVEDPIPGTYTLEVSSPGVFRPLFKAADYERFAGQPVRVELSVLHNGRRRFRGRLVGIEGDQVAVEEDEKRFEFPLSIVARATLDPEL